MTSTGNAYKKQNGIENNEKGNNFPDIIVVVTILVIKYYVLSPKMNTHNNQTSVPI